MTEFRKLPFLVAFLLLSITIIIEFVGCVGFGLTSLAAFDLLLLMTAALIGLPFITSHAIVGRLQGPITLLSSAAILLLALALLAAAIFFLFKIIGSLYFPPAYFVLYANFPAPEATAALSIAMLCKFALVFFLILAHEKLLENIGLVILVATSLLLTMMLSMLHAMPRVFVTITDDLGAIIILIVTIVRAAGFALASLPAMKKALGI